MARKRRQDPKPARALPPDRQVADAYLAELRGGATADPGQFSLDPERARELLRDRRLTDPASWALLVVQAAVLRGATQVAFACGRWKVSVSFDGLALEAGELERLAGTALETATDDRQRSLRKLAIALSTLEGAGLRQARIASGDRTDGAWLSWVPDAPIQQGRAALPEAGTRLEIRRRSPRGRLPEPGLLARRCRHAPIPVRVDGRLVSAGPHLSGLVDVLPFEAPGGRGETAFDRAASHPELRLLQHGVWIASHEPGDLPPGFVSLVEAPGLRTDLSELDVVRDDAYEALVAALRRASSSPDRALRLPVPPEALALPPRKREARRLEQLQGQDPRSEYDSLCRPGGLGLGQFTDRHDDPALVPDLVATFQRLVAECRRERTLVREHGIVWITRKLATVRSETNDETADPRSHLEIALATVEDPGLRQLVRCGLAREARRRGDLDASRRQLDRCDPAPWDVGLDSEYRIGRAMLAGYAGRWKEVLALVGRRHGEVAFAPGSEVDQGSLRAAALESLGTHWAADEEMAVMANRLAEMGARGELREDAYEGHPVLAACGAVLRRVKARRQAHQPGFVRPFGRFLAASLLGWGAVFLPVAGLLGLGAHLARRHEDRVARWPTTPGVVVQSQVQKRQGKKSAIYHELEVRYEYWVGRKRFASTQLSNGPVKGSRTALARRARSYPVGRRVTVHYDPEDPSEAHLEYQRGNLDLFLLFWAMAIVIAWLTTATVRAWRRAHA
jgi:hypothetical protein